MQIYLKSAQDEHHVPCVTSRTLEAVTPKSEAGRGFQLFVTAKVGFSRNYESSRERERKSPQKGVQMTTKTKTASTLIK